MKRVAAASLLALVAGLGIGLLFAWVIAPLRYVDTAPDTLRRGFQGSIPDTHFFILLFDPQP